MLGALFIRSTSGEGKTDLMPSISYPFSGTLPPYRATFSLGECGAGHYFDGLAHLLQGGGGWIPPLPVFLVQMRRGVQLGLALSGSGSCAQRTLLKWRSRVAGAMTFAGGCVGVVSLPLKIA